MAKIIRGGRHKVETPNVNIEHVAATLETLLEQLKGAPAPAPAKPGRMPRGTRDVERQAAEAQQPATMRDRVRDVLRENTLSYAEVAKAVGAGVEEVTAEIRAAAKDGLVANIGAEDFPMWTWRIGDETPAKELERVVRRLITERPMTTRELVHATGARFTRVGGAIVAIQRSGDKVLDLNPKTRAGRWFVVLPGARDARLAPKSNG